MAGEVKKTTVNKKVDQDADETVAVAKTGTGGRYLGLVASNIDATDYFIHLFDAEVADITLGTDVPALIVFVPAGDASKRGAVVDEPPGEVIFSTAISYAVKTVGTTTGTTGPTTPILLTIYFK